MLLDTQAVHYSQGGISSPGMRPPLPAVLLQAYDAFAHKAKYLRSARGMSQAAAEREMKRRGVSKAQKTVSNVEGAAHDSQLSSYVAVAELHGVPLWVMFVPDLPMAMLEGERLTRLTRLVQDYLRCPTDELRANLEAVARAYAAMSGE